ncbi:MAG: hypothetical protein ACLUGJ_18695 [Blautia wexlerae]
MIYAIILLQDTTQRHERDEHEQVAFRQHSMRCVPRAGQNRISSAECAMISGHLWNGIIGLLKIEWRLTFEDKELIQENHKR